MPRFLQSLGGKTNLTPVLFAFVLFGADRIHQLSTGTCGGSFLDMVAYLVDISTESATRTRRDGAQSVHLLTMLFLCTPDVGQVVWFRNRYIALPPIQRRSIDSRRCPNPAQLGRKKTEICGFEHSGGFRLLDIG